MCQMDVNGQIFSRWYNYQLEMEINSQKRIIKFQPNFVRNLTQRVLNFFGPVMTGTLKGDWYFVGKTEKFIHNQKKTN